MTTHPDPALENAVNGLKNGTYVLHLRLDAPCRLPIGGLGTLGMPHGWYAYVGSAQGPGGLAARLRRHLAGTGRMHWHIDYLRQKATPVGVWACEGAALLEHVWAQALLTMPGAGVIAPRFGASDCRCATHLVHFPALPDAALFRALAGPRLPPDAPFHVFAAPAAGDG